MGSRQAHKGEVGRKPSRPSRNPLSRADDFLDIHKTHPNSGTPREVGRTLAAAACELSRESRSTDNFGYSWNTVQNVTPSNGIVIAMVVSP